MNKLLSSLLVGSLLLFGAAPSAQAAFPEKPVTVVGLPTGGTGDLTVRMLANPLEKILGQPVVIVNKGGGPACPASNTF